MSELKLLKEEQIQQLTFEEALSRLELIVDSLEAGDVPLEKAIDLFQEGMKLANKCNQKLENIESKIEMILEKDGDFIRKPFAYEEEKE